MMQNETLAILRRRRSIRAFAPAPVPEETLHAIAESGQYAPNGGGENWHFTVITQSETLERLSSLSKEAAAASPLPWLKQLGQNDAFQPLYGAPALILVSCPEDAVTGVYDASAATENMLIAAESLGIGACWGYFITQAFDTQEGPALRAALHIPEGYKVLTSIALGYKLGENPAAPPRKPDVITFIR